MVQFVTEHAIGFGVVVGLAVGAGRGPAGLVDLAIEKGAGVKGVIGAKIDGFFHHLVAALQTPHAVLTAGETGR